MGNLSPGPPMVPIAAETQKETRSVMPGDSSHHDQERPDITVQQFTRGEVRSPVAPRDLNNGNNSAHPPLSAHLKSQIGTSSYMTSTASASDCNEACGIVVVVQETTVSNSSKEAGNTSRFSTPVPRSSGMAFCTTASAGFGDCSNGDPVPNSSSSSNVLHAHTNSRQAHAAACSANGRLPAPQSSIMFLDGTQDDEIAQGNDYDGDFELTSPPDKNNNAPKDDSDSDYVESPEDKKKKKRKQSKQEKRKRTSGNMFEGPTTPVFKRSKPFGSTTPNLKPGFGQNAQFQLYPANSASPSSFTMSPGTVVESPRSVNKSGQPRKEREPRGKLMRWNDTDWKRTVLSIVRVCGELGIEIPFEKVARSINETLTGTAFQQALLKLRLKMNDDGHAIPALKMKWSKSHEDNDTIAATLAHDSGEGNSGSTPPNPKAKETVKIVWRTPPRKPTKDQEIQTSICKVKLSVLAQQSLGDGGVKPTADVQDTPTRNKDIQKSKSATLPMTPLRPVQPNLSPPPIRSRRSRQRNNNRNNTGNVSKQFLSSINTSPSLSTPVGPDREPFTSFATTLSSTELANVQDTTLQDPFGQEWNFPPSSRNYSFSPLQNAPSGNVGIEGTAFAGFGQYYHIPGMQAPLSSQDNYSQSIGNFPTIFPTNIMPQIGDCDDLALGHGSLQNTALSMGPDDQSLSLFADRINGMAAAEENHVSIGDNAFTMDNQLVSNNYGQLPDSIGPLPDYGGDHKPQVSDLGTDKTPSFSDPQAALKAAYSRDDADTSDRELTLHATETAAPDYGSMSASNVAPELQASNSNVPKLGSPFKYKPGKFSSARVNDDSDNLFGSTSSHGDDTVFYSRANLGGFFDQQPPRLSPTPVRGWVMQTLEPQQMENGMVHESTEGEVEHMDDTFFLEGYDASGFDA